jgi:hypothetical protein
MPSEDTSIRSSDKSQYIDYHMTGDSTEIPMRYGAIAFVVIVIIAIILIVIYDPFANIAGFTGCNISKYTEQCLAKSLPYYDPTV